MTHVTAGHAKARRLYPILGKCERCADAPARDRHHINGDPFDQREENIAFLCRRCHMAVDGRAEVLAELGRKNNSGARSLPSRCSNCAKFAKPLRRGRCNACSQYFHTYGAERPEYLITGTHCHRGHEFTLENTIDNGGRRRCRECQRAVWREHARRKREAS